MKLKSALVFFAYYLFRIPFIKQIGKWFYLFYLKEFLLKLDLDSEVGIYLKGSFNSRRFIPFLSDIDLALILPNKTDIISLVNKIKELQSQFYPFLPLIGEIELIPLKVLKIYNHSNRPKADQYNYWSGQRYKKIEKIKNNLNLIDIVYVIHNYYYHSNIIKSSNHFSLTKKIKLNRLKAKNLKVLGSQNEDLNNLIINTIKNLFQELPRDIQPIILNHFFYMTNINPTFKWGFTNLSKDINEVQVIFKNLPDEVLSLLNYLLKYKNDELTLMQEQLILTRTFGHYINTYGDDIMNRTTLGFLLYALRAYEETIKNRGTNLDQLIQKYETSEKFSRDELNLAFKEVFNLSVI